MLLHNQQQFKAEDNAVIHNFFTPFLKTPLKWIPRSGASKSRPRWVAHTRIGNVWEYPPWGMKLGRFMSQSCNDS